jgi:hypothetical protein
MTNAKGIRIIVKASGAIRDDRRIRSHYVRYEGNAGGDVEEVSHRGNSESQPLKVELGKPSGVMSHAAKGAYRVLGDCRSPKADPARGSAGRRVDDREPRGLGYFETHGAPGDDAAQRSTILARCTELELARIWDASWCVAILQDVRAAWH